jgi:MFS family permease
MGTIKSKYGNPSNAGSGRKKILSVDAAVDRIGVGKFQQKVLFATGTCFMADSVQVMLLSILTRKLQREWEFSDLIASVITSCLFAGATIGTLILGPLGDRIGRKPVLVTSATIISAFGFCTALSTNYVTLVPIVFAIGFG